MTTDITDIAYENFDTVDTSTAPRRGCMTDAEYDEALAEAVQDAIDVETDKDYIEERAADLYDSPEPPVDLDAARKEYAAWVEAQRGWITDWIKDYGVYGYTSPDRYNEAPLELSEALVSREDALNLDDVIRKHAH